MEALSNLFSSGSEFTPLMEMFLLMTILMFLPAMIFMMTSFVRIVITFSFIKSALGAQQSIPSQILVGLALCLTMFIMTPVLNDITDNALKPYMEESISREEAMEEAKKPIRVFLLNQTREEDLDLFVQSSTLNSEEVTKENVPLYVLVPAFAISELKTAFQIGFLIYVPFLVIDLVVSSTLMSMGMFMLPPASISLPIKLLLFVMVDGWNLLIKSLLLSFTG